MKVTKQQLQNSFELLAKVSQYKTTEKEAINSNKEFYLSIDYNPTYGGYRLDLVKVGSGAVYGVFGYSTMGERLKIKEFNDRLRAIIAGIEFAKKNPCYI
jgi:hypothetical protein